MAFNSTLAAAANTGVSGISGTPTGNSASGAGSALLLYGRKPIQSGYLCIYTSASGGGGALRCDWFDRQRRGGFPEN